MTAEDAPAEVPETEELAQAGMELAMPEMSNSLGVFDGYCMALRSFPIWYRWRPVGVELKHDKPESGTISGVEFQQSMGRMTLWHHLVEQESALTEDDLCVELSCWQVQVTIGRDIQYVKGKTTGKKLECLCGDLWEDIRFNLSWWELVQDPAGDGKWLALHLAKLEHRAWKGPWFTDPFHPHRRSSFGWTELHQSAPKRDDDKLVRTQPGRPQNYEEETCTGFAVETLCTGMDDEEDEWTATVYIHLDEESVETATAKVPMEELFSADIHADSVQVYLRNEGFGICVGRLTGSIVPEFSMWEISSVRRTNLPKDSRIKCPAFYNPAIRIKLVKAEGSQHIWGSVFADLQKAAFEAPRERMKWTERVQRALVLAPGAPLKTHIKAENALKMVSNVETSQDTVTQKAIITLHLDQALEELAFKFKLDLTTFFALRVGESSLEVSIIADSEFPMIQGELGGSVDANRTTWEIVREQEHLALKISLAKATGHRERWGKVFTRMTKWEVAEKLRPALPAPEESKQSAIADAESEQATN